MGIVLFDKIEYEEFLNFIEVVNDDFEPHLSERVNLSDFALKMIDFGTIFIYRDTFDKVVGIICLYCNDFKNRYAYIPFVGVLKSCRGLGIASALIDRAISHSKIVGMGRIGLHVSNPFAIKMYKKKGFIVIDKEISKKEYMELVL